MSRYTVELYNKDADTYTVVTHTNDLEYAKLLCEDLSVLTKQDMIIDRGSAYTEPFDWVEVYDEEYEERIYVR